MASSLTINSAASSTGQPDRNEVTNRRASRTEAGELRKDRDMRQADMETLRRLGGYTSTCEA
ncbi:hypothetical protein Sru01_57000 [Sphaerisporangium rufum]|uniref:Uncharacterized protein n=1 Tax=Sphaerisporangium rufum TaxID=1381558 RepID=A0A919R7K9_9ACTN|nr:hypothetical protein Sru01_57000 [Sphaerisporangium rufum]